MRRTLLAIVVAATLLTGGCFVPLIGSDDAGLTPEQSRAELYSRPDIATATARLETMLDEIQAALTTDAALPGTWELDQNVSRRGCAGFTGLGGESRATTSRILRTQILDSQRDAVLTLVDRISIRYGFGSTRTFADEPGRLTMIQFGPDEATFVTGQVSLGVAS